MISYKKIFHGCIWALFIGFLVLYFAQANGYYEDMQSRKATLTEDKIKKFEKDIKEGKTIKVENYVVNMKKDYSNPASNFGLHTSKIIGKYFKKVMNKLFNGANDMMKE